MRPFGTVEREIPAIAGRAARPRWSPLVLAVQIGVVGLITVPAWLLGGIEPGIQVWLFLAASCAMLVCWFACLDRRTASTPLPVALIPLALVIALGILQLAPLPLDVRKRVSPTTAGWWESLDPQAPRTEVESAAFFLGAVPFSDRLGFLIAGDYQRPGSRPEYVSGRIQKTKNTRHCYEK